MADLNLPWGNLLGQFYTSSLAPGPVSFGTYDPSSTDPLDPLNINAILDFSKTTGFLNIAGGSQFFTGQFSGETNPVNYQLDLAIDTASSNLQPVPEPSTFLLLGAGLSGFGLMRRRMKN